MGFILGTVTIFNYGAGPAGIMRTLGKYMAGSAATFRYALRGPCRYTTELIYDCSVFMGVGSVIRTDTSPVMSEVWARSQYPPLLHQRQYPRAPRR
jgi:Reactive mitochondrial oxygen species modulator 1